MKEEGEGVVLLPLGRACWAIPPLEVREIHRLAWMFNDFQAGNLPGAPRVPIPLATCWMAMAYGFWSLQFDKSPKPNQTTPLPSPLQKKGKAKKHKRLKTNNAL